MFLEKRYGVGRHSQMPATMTKENERTFLRTPLSIYLECFPSVLPKGAELDWACADLTLWHRKLGYMVCYERLPLPLDAKGLLRDGSGNTMSASSNVAVVSGLMYAARFLHPWRKSEDESAPVFGWWRRWPKESLAQACHFAQLQRTPFTL